MQDFRQYFKGKKVTVVGLGLLGKRLGDIAFLAECGAHLTVTDLKSSQELRPSLLKLRKYKGIKYVLGKHRLEDFENKDFILKGQGVALDSPYIAHARKNGIPIEMDESLFAKLAPKVEIIGVTGTRGKSTTTVLIYEILKRARMKVHLGGNIKGTAALPLLREVKNGDLVVFELSSWQLQGFGEAKISPHIAVFTNFMPDHMNYYKNNLKTYFGDKAYIYKFQKKLAPSKGGEDVLVLGPQMKKLVKKAPSKVIHATLKNLPESNLLGKHNKENIACALAVARALKIKEPIIQKAVKNFKGIEGRLELVKTVKGVKIYNDTNSTTPEATIAALNSFKNRVILIMGGTDKGLDLRHLLSALKKKTKKIILLHGSGSDRIKAKAHKVSNLNKAVAEAMREAQKGDTILFSPAFTSFGMFTNEYDRGDIFMEIIKKLK